MEKLQHYKNILALGRLLVKELDLEQSVDTLGRWMAHHISELIIEAENAKGRDKSDVAERCREAILALWEHIRVFPRGQRPLADIEPLLSTIQALDPENQGYFYKTEALSQIDQSTLSDQAKDWLELSHEIDFTARVLIEMCLKKATNEIIEEKRDLVELAKSIEADTPITSIIITLTNEYEKSDEEQKADVIQKAIKTLKNRREHLNAMIEKVKLLVSSIDDDIKNMEQSFDNTESKG